MIHVPDLAYNLLSVTSARKVGVNVNFGTKQYMEKQGVRVMFKGVDNDDIYVVEMRKISKGPLLAGMSVEKRIHAQLLHHMLGHPSEEAMRRFGKI